MIGKLGGTGISEHSGLTPRVATLLFDVARSAPKMHEFLIEASFLEIYNEKVRDLLEPSSSPDSLKIRESPQLGVHITGLTRKRVTSAASVARVLITGFQNRTVSATTYNAESSRSHAIFEIVIQQKYVDELSGQQMAKSSKINMVDLAGSERSDKVGTTGASLVEGNNINKSLTVLGRCIKVCSNTIYTYVYINKQREREKSLFIMQAPRSPVVDDVIYLRDYLFHLFMFHHSCLRHLSYANLFTTHIHTGIGRQWQVASNGQKKEKGRESRQIQRRVSLPFLLSFALFAP
jgi:hypothetical protein